jgi:hypothetical protein
MLYLHQQSLIERAGEHSAVVNHPPGGEVEDSFDKTTGVGLSNERKVDSS